MSVSIYGHVILDIDDVNCCNLVDDDPIVDFTIVVPVPDDYQVGDNSLVVNFDDTSAIDVYCDYCDDMHYISYYDFKIDNFVVTDDDIYPSINMDDIDVNWDNGIIDVLTTKIHVTVDTHWDCYCKTRKVCGCGCDPLHDGW